MTEKSVRIRALPAYTRRQESFNTVSHCCGICLGVAVLVLTVLKSAAEGRPDGIFASVVYGGTMILTYVMSSLYHGAEHGRGKCVLRVLDHCAVFLLIAGTYTPITVCGILPEYPTIGRGLTVLQWAAAAAGIILNAVNMEKYSAFSMVCYLVSGCSLLAFPAIAVEVMTLPGFMYIICGGACYIAGSVLYAVAKRKNRLSMHGVFHIFVLAGSLIQFFGIYLFIL